jgi:DNA-binding MarR family transcriptional regulator
MDLSRPASDLQELVGVIVRGLEGDRDLSLTAFSTLASLDRRGPQRITQLAAAEGVSQPSMTQLVQRLEQRGLVTRTSDPADGRVALVRLTGQGRAAVHARRRRNTGLIAAVLETIPEADVQALADALAAVLPALSAGFGPRAQARAGDGTDVSASSKPGSEAI